MRSKKTPKTLGNIDALQISCSDCGRTKIWSRAHIESRNLPSDATVDDLGGALVCSSCQHQGGLGHNVEIRVISCDGVPSGDRQRAA